MASTIETEDLAFIEEINLFLQNEDFPCIAAKAALRKQQVECFIADHLACAKDDKKILDFLYEFVLNYRKSDRLFHSAIVVFKETEPLSEHLFDQLLWQRLQALTDLDSKNFHYDTRVSPNPSSVDFSFSIKEEAFFIIGLHSLSNRKSRRFKHTALVFNPHQQFQKLKELNKYTILKEVIRKRDITFSGSVNPMLEDFGLKSEVFQYSGLKYSNDWKCPLKIHHAAIRNNKST